MRIRSFRETNWRKKFKVGWFDNVFGRKAKPAKELTKEQRKAISEIDDYDDSRPYFTYYITTVQIIVLFLALIFYGLAPMGFQKTQRTGLILLTSLSRHQVDYMESTNFWLGPPAVSLLSYLSFRYLIFV